ncbi:MAG: ATP phosphoribosyltransferase regulatory subunit [Microthrixaceae bacterium]
MLQGLDAVGVEYTESPLLVRGLDYYRRTTFEFAATALDAAQNAVGGGGRYDGLAEDLGGPPTDGIGFALGVDRILLACDAEGVFPAVAAKLDVFVVDVVDGTTARDLTHELPRRRLPRRPQVRRRFHEVADEERRPVRRGPRPDRRRGRSRPRAQSPCGRSAVASSGRVARDGLVAELRRSLPGITSHTSTSIDTPRTAT